MLYNSKDTELYSKYVITPSRTLESLWLADTHSPLVADPGANSLTKNHDHCPEKKDVCVCMW